MFGSLPSNFGQLFLSANYSEIGNTEIHHTASNCTYISFMIWPDKDDANSICPLGSGFNTAAAHGPWSPSCGMKDGVKSVDFALFVPGDIAGYPVSHLLIIDICEALYETLVLVKI
jgi:hypothetical protein